MDLFTVLIAVIAWVMGLVVLAWIIRSSVRRGIEEVLYHRDKDGRWEAHPDLVNAVRNIQAKTRD